MKRLEWRKRKLPRATESRRCRKRYEANHAISNHAIRLPKIFIQRCGPKSVGLDFLHTSTYRSYLPTTKTGGLASTFRIFIWAQHIQHLRQWLSGIIPKPDMYRWWRWHHCDHTAFSSTPRPQEALLGSEACRTRTSPPAGFRRCLGRCGMRNRQRQEVESRHSLEGRDIA